MKITEFLQSFSFSAKIQISNLTRFHSEFNLWTKIGLLPQFKSVSKVTLNPDCENSIEIVQRINIKIESGKARISNFGSLSKWSPSSL